MIIYRIMKMKNMLLILSFLLFFGVKPQAQTPTAGKDPVEEKTNAVATRLNLDEEKKKAVYNIFSQTDKRITDLAPGTPDYTKLINYINQERADMLKAALSPEEYESYRKFYATGDNNEINAYIKKNNAFLTKQAAEEAKAKKSNERLMQADKLAEKKAADKQKLAEKKAAEKQKLAEKKAAEKQKLAEKKAAEKQKLADKKAADKEKAAAKREKEKQKREEAKQKSEEKRNAAKQKALEKKQKELDKKLNKK
jgi:septal ring factor EnvC (AmiA/AmiB activator)